MDTMPTTLHGFLAPAAAGTMRAWASLLNGQLAGLNWLHDINCWGGHNTAWKGMYIFPEFRRISTVDWSRISSDAAAAIGLRRNFVGIRVRNQNAMGFAKKTGFTLAGVVEKFGWFLGELDDLAIWSRYPEDVPEALRQARLRAEYYRANPPATVLTSSH